MVNRKDVSAMQNFHVTETNFNFVKEKLPKRISDSHKGTYGTVISVTGSCSMPGAAVLSGRGALRSGLGLLKQCAPRENIAALAAGFPEPVYVPVKTDEDGFYSPENARMLLGLSEKAQAVLIGCGLGCTDGTGKLVRNLLGSLSCPVVLDADGLNCIAGSPEILCEISCPVIITPHPAEAARLMGVSVSEIQADRYESIRRFTEKFPNVVTVLKGAGTLIGYGGRYRINTTGNPGMSPGGSGDVLAGITASLLAQGMEVFDAAVCAVWLHGRAGDIAAQKYGMAGMIPSDMTEYIVFDWRN